MSSYRQLLYHIVFRTYSSQPAIRQEYAGQLYAYITGIIKNKNSQPYRINGVENHIHTLTEIHPSVALADFVKDIKVASSIWMKSSGLFPSFMGWAEGYGSFTCSYLDTGRLIEYIKGQQEHHRKKTFEEEYKTLLTEACPRLHRGLFIFGSSRAEEYIVVFHHQITLGVINITLLQNRLLH